MHPIDVDIHPSINDVLLYGIIAITAPIIKENNWKKKQILINDNNILPFLNNK